MTTDDRTGSQPTRISGPSPAMREPELIFGLVAPIGADLDHFIYVLERKLQRFGYRANLIRISELMATFVTTPSEQSATGSKEYVRIADGMRDGNSLRQSSGKGEFLALAAAAKIGRDRSGEQTFLPRTAHVIRSLKHPDEVRALRRIYGSGFFLIGLAVPDHKRRSFLVEDKRCTELEAEELLRRDEHEEDHGYITSPGNFGQRTRDTYHLSDVFVRVDEEDGIHRFLDLIFGCPFITPTRDEHAMFLAYAASLRSSDLSRQVGAVVVSEGGDVIGIGMNDVPRGGGGLYWPDDERDGRDFQRGADSNEQRRTEILRQVLDALRPDDVDQEEWRVEGLRRLKKTPLMDITEYGRAAHAEMEALLACGRSGSPAVSGTLFCTTFPCHNCAKHIVAAGVARVVYVEPYPKSQAAKLFSDSIYLDSAQRSAEGQKVHFQPFIGVGARRFVELFSLSVASAGNAKLRKISGGAVAPWTPESAVICAPLLPNSYLEREKLAAAELLEHLHRHPEGEST